MELYLIEWQTRDPDLDPGPALGLGPGPGSSNFRVFALSNSSIFEHPPLLLHAVRDLDLRKVSTEENVYRIDEH